MTEARDVALTTAYNERLFAGGGLRSYYHKARFLWVREKMKQCLGTGLRLVELGCYDGRLLDTLGDVVSDYAGLDANWAGGLDLARRKYRGHPRVILIEGSTPAMFHRFPDGRFDAAAALETLEHVPPDLVGPFLDQLQRVTRGYLFVTVPNELGAIFLIKYLAKRTVFGEAEPYTPSEFLAATLWRSDKVERTYHKGFDYRKVIAEVRDRFEVVAVEGIASLGLPPALSPTVGIVARSLRTS